MSALRLILGDQLSANISSLKKIDPENDIILIVEVARETTYVKHHPKKIAFLFSAMRHFAEDLKNRGFHVDYVHLDDEGNSGSFSGEVKRAVTRHKPEQIVVTFPGEYRVLEEIRTWQDDLGLPVHILEDDRFLCGREAFAEWAKGRKQLRMEFFYREMRQKYRVLMDGNEPQGGQWNYDQDNRKPPKDGLSVPEPSRFEPDPITEQVLALVEERFENHFGDLYPFHFAVTSDQAQTVLDHFIKERLPKFGDFQDAMIQNEPWMYHGHLSFYLNSGLLDPMTCILAAEAAYHAGEAPLNAVEGFIRQILGWREYVRGIYWLKMPDYAEANFLNAQRNLPEFYWTGDTKMNCLRQCIGETKANAYAHHIQRLMVLGNFALLIGAHPKQVNEWYLVVYADAYEWVEMPNVTGMILFADGGLLASKPYAAGGSYINRMSNYCGSCHYKNSKKNGEDACPFNYLYWGFLREHRDRLHKNPRVAMMYKTLDRMAADKKKQIDTDCNRFLSALDHGEPV